MTALKGVINMSSIDIHHAATNAAQTLNLGCKDRVPACMWGGIYVFWAKYSLYSKTKDTGYNLSEWCTQIVER